MSTLYACAFCGEQVAEDPENGGFVHLGTDGDPDRFDRGHYAEPEYAPLEGW